MLNESEPDFLRADSFANVCCDKSNICWEFYVWTGCQGFLLQIDAVCLLRQKWVSQKIAKLISSKISNYHKNQQALSVVVSYTVLHPYTQLSCTTPNFYALKYILKSWALRFTLCAHFLWNWPRSLIINGLFHRI